jgi:hypothetical protein
MPASRRFESSIPAMRIRGSAIAKRYHVAVKK